MSGITLSKKLFLLFFRHRIIHHLSIYFFFFCFNIIFIVLSIRSMFQSFSSSPFDIYTSRAWIYVYIYIFFFLIFYNVKFRLKFVRSRLRSRTRVRSVTLMTCLVIRNSIHIIVHACISNIPHTEKNRSECYACRAWYTYIHK